MEFECERHSRGELESDPLEACGRNSVREAARGLRKVQQRILRS